MPRHASTRLKRAPRSRFEVIRRPTTQVLSHGPQATWFRKPGGRSASEILEHRHHLTVSFNNWNPLRKGVIGSDGLMAEYPGLPGGAIDQIHRVLREARNAPLAWLVSNLRSVIADVYVSAGVSRQDAERFANGIASTETRAIRGVREIASWRSEEGRRGRALRYRIRDGDDFRTTRMSRWIQVQIPPKGVSLNQLEVLLDQAVEHAKRGAFLDGGELSSVKGIPVAVPVWFRRRGFSVHFIDPTNERYDVEERHTVTRVV